MAENKNAIFIMRMKNKDKAIFLQYAQIKGISVADMLTENMLNVIKNVKNIPKKLKNLSEMSKKECELKDKREDMRIFMHNQYLITNTIRRLYIIIRTQLLMSDGMELDMQQINAIISRTKCIYKSFSYDNKRLLKKQMAQLENWKNPNYIKDKLKVMNAIKRGDDYRNRIEYEGENGNI